MNLFSKHFKLFKNSCFLQIDLINYYSVLFFGSDSFSLESLQILNYNKSIGNIIKNIEVVSSSKYNIIGKYCQQKQIPFHRWPYYENKLFDIGVVSSFGHLIPSRIIDLCDLGVINVHPSLLPRWRGASPIQYSILFHDKITGVTIMRIKPKKFDIGEIVLQEQFVIPQRATSMILFDVLSKKGAELLWKCFENLEINLANSREQPNEGITHAPKLKPTDGLINWSQMTSKDIDLRYRALNNFIPIYTYWINGDELHLYDILDPDFMTNIKFDLSYTSPGQVCFNKKYKILCICCADNKLAGIGTVCFKGRKKISALQFNNGYLQKCKSDKIILGINNQKDNLCKINSIT